MLAQCLEDALAQAMAESAARVQVARRGKLSKILNRLNASVVWEEWKPEVVTSTARQRAAEGR